MKLFSRDNKKAEAKGAPLRLLIELTLGVVLALLFVSVDWEGAVDAAVQLRDRFLDHEIFSVREIQVKAGEKIGGSEIVATAGLSHGMSLWRVDPVAIEKKVARNPWVKRVLVRREFPRRVAIEVEDTGSGMTPDQLERLYDRFYRGPGEDGRAGFGLGLPITKEAVEAIGGRIEIESVQGQGTLATIVLPPADVPVPA